MWCLSSPMGFPGGLDSKESASHAGERGSVPGLGRYTGEGNGSPLECSCLENSMDRGAWQAAGHGVTKSQTGLRDFHFLFIMLITSCYWKLNSDFLCTFDSYLQPLFPLQPSVPLLPYWVLPEPCLYIWSNTSITYVFHKYDWNINCFVFFLPR